MMTLDDVQKVLGIVNLALLGTLLFSMLVAGHWYLWRLTHPVEDEPQRGRWFAQARRVRHPHPPAVRLAPRVLIEQRAWQKLHSYARSVETEINGVGICRLDGGDLRVTDIFTLPQQAGHGFATIEGVEIARAIDDYVAAGGNAEEMCVQWHSHGDLGVHWSYTDEDNIEDYFGLGKFGVSLEVNRQGAVLCRVDVRVPFRFTVEVPPVVIADLYPDAVVAACLEEVKRNVVQVERPWVNAVTFGRYGAHPAGAQDPRAEDPDALLEFASEAGPDGKARLVATPEGDTHGS